ncbi:MAG: hypothetical protein J7575_04375 [Chloroflexi bacterium]|nr:hypothetical protein [Chloroflexota bacterium]
MSSFTMASRQWRWMERASGDTVGERPGNLSRIQRLRRLLRRTIRRRRSRQELPR